MSFYENLLADADYGHGVHVLDEKVDYAWTVEWDGTQNAFYSQVTKWIDGPDADGKYGDAITASAIGITRADAAERAMDAFLEEVLAPRKPAAAVERIERYSMK